MLHLRNPEIQICTTRLCSLAASITITHDLTFGDTMKHQYTLKTFITLGFITLLLATHAKANAADSIENLFDNYMLKYNTYIQSGEFNQDLHLYRDKVMLVTNNGSQTGLTAAEMDQRVVVFLDNLKQQGVAKVQWESQNITRLDTNLAVVKNVAIRFASDNSVVNRVGATYLIQNGSNGWKIAAFSIHTPEHG